MCLAPTVDCTARFKLLHLIFTLCSGCTAIDFTRPEKFATLVSRRSSLGLIRRHGS